MANPQPVYVISAESGPASLQSRMRAICRVKGIDPARLPIQWYTKVEQLSTPEGCRNLENALRHFGSKLVFLDPGYLLLGGDVTSESAGNMFAMGGLLANVDAACKAAGATCVVVTHANGRVPEGKPMELSHIAWSGFQQWARQWWLISRRTPYQDDGRHALFLRYGGSAGHTGLLHVDIDEGTIETGKQWDVLATDGWKAIREEKAAAATEKQDGLRKNCDKVMKAMDEIIAEGNEVATKSAIERKAKLTRAQVKAAYDRLLADGLAAPDTGRIICGTSWKDEKGIRRPESGSD